MTNGLLQRPRGLVACTDCPHPSATHDPGGDRPCRVALCGCRGYASVEAPPETPSDGPNGVFLIIPDGYTMTITLTPVGGDA